MKQTDINAAAQFYQERRVNEQARGRLPAELRPESMDDAFAIQKALIIAMGDRVGGWKCIQPSADLINIGAIFARTIHTQSPCPIKLDQGVCRVEPEIVFRFGQDLPCRDTDYAEEEIIAALAGAHMGLELIQNRYAGTEEVSYAENLADNLFNQGMFLGPQVDLEQAIAAAEIEFVLQQETTEQIKGQHPNRGPLLPVLWLVNFLRQHGMGIEAGQLVTTGSYAGVLEVKPDIEIKLQYRGLGELNVLFQAR